MALSTHSAGPRKNRPAGSPYVPSNVRFARPCWSCRARNTTGSTSSPARRKLPVPAGHRSEVRRPQVQRKRRAFRNQRSEEHTSELQSHVNLVCRLLLEKKKKT